MWKRLLKASLKHEENMIIGGNMCQASRDFTEMILKTESLSSTMLSVKNLATEMTHGLKLS